MMTQLTHETESDRAMAFRWPITVVAGAAIVALSAQVALPLPFTPVPMSLQGLAVLLVGGLFGATVAVWSMAVYLLAGAVGLPVFAMGGSGLVRLFGPTGGYLLAFPVAALVVGTVARRGHLGRCFIAALAGMAAIHAGGWALLTLQSTDAARAAALGVVPFLLQDSLKVLIATAVLWRGHDLLRPRA